MTVYIYFTELENYIWFVQPQILNASNTYIMRKFTFSLPSNLLILALFALNFFFFESYAQVGIGTTSPQAMLDVLASDPDNPTAKDGFLMPRVTSLSQDFQSTTVGTMVFYTGSTGTGNGNMKNTIYFFDGNNWKNMSGESASTTDPKSLYDWDAVHKGVVYWIDPSNSITVTGLEANTSYTFYVTAYDASMNESTSSNTASETTQSGCVASTICETSFEGTNGCWTLFTDNGSNDINNTSSPGCSYSAYNGSNVIEIQQDGGVRTSSNDFTGNTSVDVSFYHTGYNKPNSHSCSGAITNTVYLEVSTNGISWTVIESYSSSSTWQQATGTIDGVYMTSGIYIRIRVDGDSNKDYTLLDSTRIDVNCD